MAFIDEIVDGVDRARRLICLSFAHWYWSCIVVEHLPILPCGVRFVLRKCCAAAVERVWPSLSFPQKVDLCEVFWEEIQKNATEFSIAVDRCCKDILASN